MELDDLISTQEMYQPEAFYVRSDHWERITRQPHTRLTEKITRTKMINSTRIYLVYDDNHPDVRLQP